jgi:hypothetical protein
MEGLSYYNLEDLIEKVASGELDVHRPIDLSNDVRNQKFEIPFLQHLLMICKNEGFSLVHLLSMIHSRIKSNVLELIHDNAFVRHMVQNTLNEWRLDISPFDIFKDGLDELEGVDQEELFQYHKLSDENKVLREIETSLDDLEGELSDRTVILQVVPNKEKVRHLDRRIRVLHGGCYDSMTRIQETMKELEEKTKAITPTYNHVLLDMAMKHKSSYLEFYKNSTDNDDSTITMFINERNQVSIPNKIHNVFMNYCLIVNMVRKEFEYLNHVFAGLSEKAESKTTMMTQYVDGLNIDDLIHDIDAQEREQERNREPTMFEQLSKMLGSSGKTGKTDDKEGLYELKEGDIGAGLEEDVREGEGEGVKGGSFF